VTPQSADRDRLEVVDGPDRDVELDSTGAEVLRLRAEVERLRARVVELEAGKPVAATRVEAWSPKLLDARDSPSCLPIVDNDSPAELKVALFRALFVGRDDVYALRWESSSTGKKGWRPASKHGWRRGADPGELLPLTDEVVAAHLRGRSTVGLYPLMRGDVCRLLACDLDGHGWELDSRAYLEACEAVGVPAALERSRSGRGGHVWPFFDAPVPAASARALGAALLREAMTLRAELDLASYDRLFPSQDFLPAGALFGNLIALPLQRDCRQRGTTVFVDPQTFRPRPDQWAFLSSMPRLSPDAVESLRVALRPAAVGPEERRHSRGSRRRDAGSPPAVIRGVRGAMLGVERAGLPPWLVADLKHLASVHNPEFYRRERQRLPTWNVPRLIRCYEEDLEYLWLPRGLAEHTEKIAAEVGSRLELDDTFTDPEPVDFEFDATLTDTQKSAVLALAGHHQGVLVAPTGAGKTVMACALIAHHRVPALIVVDRQQLADQWRTQLAELLSLTGRQVGQLGGGRKRRGYVVDLAMFQSIAKRADDQDLFSGYGLVVVDECHHVPAPSYERTMRHAPVRRWLGLTATPHREDGLHPLITMQCGPIRHTLTRGSGPLLLRVVTHESLADPPLGDQAPYQDLLSGLTADEERNAAITGDVIAALGRGRHCLVLTQRTAHLERLTTLLQQGGEVAHVLRGGMGKKQRTAVSEAISNHPEDRPLLVAATGPYAGEGFDCPRLDTLFLALPIKSRTKLTQYVGRIMRDHPSKADVEVHDYNDRLIPMLRRSTAARLSCYATLGFDLSPSPETRHQSATSLR
jgi:superfamily II DNA or RNA helicase